MKSCLAAAVLLLVAIAAVGVWSRPARGQESRASRWEYCYLHNATFGEGPRSNQFIAKVTYFTNRGIRVAAVDRGELLVDAEAKGATPARNDETAVVLAHAVAKLGSEGWELVTVSDAEKGIFMISNGALFKRETR